MSSIDAVVRKHSIFGFQSPLEWLLIGVTAVINIAVWAATGLLVQSHGQVTPLHYTIYFGIDLTAAANSLYYIPGFGALIWGSHIIAARAIPHQAWRRSWLVLNLVFQLLLGGVLAALAYISTHQ